MVDPTVGTGQLPRVGPYGKGRTAAAAAAAAAGGPTPHQAAAGLGDASEEKIAPVGEAVTDAPGRDAIAAIKSPT